MQLTKDTFQLPGVFTGRPVRKEITWKCGDEELSATTWIRMMSYLDVDS
ncbi:TPA: phage tail assembly chaperone family protein, TAC, partial [Escherichia coli]|nr:phage tail assembly chaperone family protein, TAC [Escherichia coli]